MAESHRFRETAGMPRPLFRSGPALLLFSVLATVGAGGACASLPPTGEWSPPAADTSAFLVRTFGLGNEGSITPNARAYAISPDWTLLAAPLDDGSLNLFDLASGQSAGRPLEGGFDVGMWTYATSPLQPFTFTFSSDGKLLVWSWGKKLVVWDVATRDVLLRQEIEGFKSDAIGAGVHVAPGGGFLAWTTDDGVAVWDSSSGRVVHAVAGSGVCGFSPDGRLLALTGSIWDLARGQPLEESLGGRCLGFSPDGRYVLTTQYDGTGLWDVTGSRAPTRLSEHEAWRQAWSANGRFLAFANDDRNVEVWDLESKPPTQRVLSEREKEWMGSPCWPSLLLSRDGTLLSDSCLITDLWDLSRPTPRLMLRTGRVPISPPGGRAGRAGPPVLSQDGRTLVYTWGSGRRGAGNGGFGLWDVANGRPVGPRVEVRYFGRMELSPDGSLLATAGWGPDPSGNEGFILQIWSVEAIRSAAAWRASATSALSQ